MNTEIALSGANIPAVGGSWTTEQIQLIKTQICKGASDDELKLFLYQCKRTGLDPLTRQIYAIQRKQWDPEQGQTISKMSIQTSIDGFRLVAERSGKYAGQAGPFWCGEDGKWLDFWHGNTHPLAAKVGVIRSDFKEPLFAVAHWDEYAQKFFDKKTNSEKIGSMWAKMPALMLSKVAESLALRKAFPIELSGLYSQDEMPQAEPQIELERPAPTVIDDATKRSIWTELTEKLLMSEKDAKDFLALHSGKPNSNLWNTQDLDRVRNAIERAKNDKALG